jgi:hypothetical protein
MSEPTTVDPNQPNMPSSTATSTKSCNNLVVSSAQMTLR